MHLHRKVLTTYFVLQSLHKVRPSTALYYTACTKYVPVPFCTTKLAQSSSQRYFVLQSLHKVRPSTTSYYKESLHKVLPSTILYYKACTKYFPALLRTSKLAQRTSQYYFVLQRKLAQSTSQYYFVLQSLHKALPSTTLYYKAYTKYFPAAYDYRSLDAATPIQFTRSSCKRQKYYARSGGAKQP